MTDWSQAEPVTACIGQTVSLDAPRAGIGGYVWSLDLDPAVGRLVSKETAPPSDGKVGAGGTSRFNVEMTGTANGAVRLVLKRPWEPEPLRVIEYPVRCVGDSSSDRPRD